MVNSKGMPMAWAMNCRLSTIAGNFNVNSKFVILIINLHTVKF